MIEILGKLFCAGLLVLMVLGALGEIVANAKNVQKKYDENRFRIAFEEWQDELENAIKAIQGKDEK